MLLRKGLDSGAQPLRCSTCTCNISQVPRKGPSFAPSVTRPSKWPVVNLWGPVSVHFSKQVPGAFCSSVSCSCMPCIALISSNNMQQHLVQSNCRLQQAAGASKRAGPTLQPFTLSAAASPQYPSHRMLQPELRNRLSGARPAWSSACCSSSVCALWRCDRGHDGD